MKNRPAFTLLEVMVALAVAAAVSVVAMPKMAGVVVKAKATQCLANRTVIERAEERYRSDHDGQPSAGLEDLKASRYIDRVPRCSAGGHYIWVSTAAPVKLGCTVHDWPISSAAPSALFSSSFDGMQGLTPLTGAWSVANGILQPTRLEARLSFGDAAWKDYDVTLNATLKSGNGYGVYYRADGKAAISGYCFQYDPGWGGGAFLVRKVVNGAESGPIAVARMPAGFPIYGSSHQIKVVVSGASQKIYVDSVEVLSFSDATFSAGSAGLRAWDSTKAGFDSVVVKPV